MSVQNNEWKWKWNQHIHQCLPYFWNNFGWKIYVKFSYNSGKFISISASYDGDDVDKLWLRTCLPKHFLMLYNTLQRTNDALCQLSSKSIDWAPIGFVWHFFGVLRFFSSSSFHLALEDSFFVLESKSAHITSQYIQFVRA